MNFHMDKWFFKIILLSLLLIFYGCTGDTAIPNAKIRVSEFRYLQNYPITFYAEIAPGQTTSDFEYSWDYGDSTTGTGLMSSHSFTHPGEYQVTLTVSGGAGSDMDMRTIRVKSSLKLLETHPIAVDEPSGLAFGLNFESLWTVSDRTARVYQLDFEGNVLRTLSYRGSDLEGISFDNRDSTLWIISENQSALIHIDTNGVLLENITVPSVSDGSGLEGIAVDALHSRIFLLKEKDFSALLALDENLNTSSYRRIGFAPDYSGLFYADLSDELWMLSHESSSLFLTDTSGAMLREYGFLMNQPEGLVFHEIDSLFYIVDDAHETMNVYGFWE